MPESNTDIGHWVLQVCGCDDETVVPVDLTEEELGLLVRIAKTVSTEAKHRNCMPTMSVHHPAPCSSCEGTGVEPYPYDDDDLVCRFCHGSKIEAGKKVEVPDAE
jgi:hypothetical protein